MKYETAVDNLKKYYGSTATDYIPIDAVFNNAGRGDYSLQANRTWSHGKFSLMKPHGLFKVIKGVEDGKYVTVGIRLTDKGREAIRSTTASQLPTQSRLVLEPTPDALPVPLTSLPQRGRSVSVDTIFNDIETLKMQSPYLDIEFSLSIKSREVPMK